MTELMMASFTLLTLPLSCMALSIGEVDLTALSLNPTSFANSSKLHGLLFPILMPTGLFGNMDTQAAANNAATDKQLREINTRLSELTDIFRNISEHIVNSQKSSENPIPKCPSQAAAKGAKMVDNLCLSVEGLNDAETQTFWNSRTECFKKGGMLAEPIYDHQDFYTELRTAFAPKFNTNGMHVNIATQGPTPGLVTYEYKYLHSGFVVPPTHPVWAVEAPTAWAAVAFIPFIASDSTKWLASANNGEITRGYICQYPSV